MTLSEKGMRRLEALEILATSPKPVLVMELPFRVESRANDHRSNHWGDRAKTSGKQRVGTHLALSGHRRGLVKLMSRAGLVVRVVRVGPKELDSHDNLGMALKAITDGVADALGVPDHDARVMFVADGEVGPWGARIEFYERGAP